MVPADTNAADAPPLDPSLVVWFPMDGEFVSPSLDATGQGDAATCEGTRCPIRVPGIRGFALEFDGIDDRLVVPDSPRLRLTTAFTISVWLQWFGGDAAVIAKPELEGTGASFEISILPGAILVCTDDTLGPLGESCLERAGPPPMATWTAIALTWDGQIRTLFLDGVAVASGAHGVAYDEHFLIIGGDNHDSEPSSSHRGLIDELRIYNRVLSASEIAALHTP